MNRYTLTLDGGQLACLIRLVQEGLDQCKTNAMHTTHLCTVIDGREPTAEQADNMLDAFSRGPKLVALLEEHLALGPEPKYPQSE